MGLQVRKLHQGSTPAVSLTLTDQDGNAIDWTAGTLSALLTPTSGTAITIQGTNTNANSGIGVVTLSAATLSSRIRRISNAVPARPTRFLWEGIGIS